MTVLTNVSGADMIKCSAPGNDTVVTGHTGLGDLLVIKFCGYPGCGRVAIIALCHGRQVVEVFTGADDAIMAGIATSKHLQMIHTLQGGPDIGGVTVLADIGAGDVIETLAFGDDRVMTGGTCFGDLLMIKVGRCPCSGAVTIITLSHCWQVVDGFALADATVVATVTTAQYLEVIHLCRRFPCVGGMTIFTDIG